VELFFCIVLVMLLLSEPPEQSHLALFVDEVTKHHIFQAKELNIEAQTTREYAEKLGRM